MITFAGKEAMEFLKINEEQVISMFESFASELHYDFLKSGELSEIKNGSLPMTAVFWGEGFYGQKEHALDKIPNRHMVCSEFASYSTIIR